MKQENITYNQEKNCSTEMDLEMTVMMELTDKDLKVAAVDKPQALKGRHERTTHRTRSIRHSF